jgi:hypothetical protein
MLDKGDPPLLAESIAEAPDTIRSPRSGGRGRLALAPPAKRLTAENETGLSKIATAATISSITVVPRRRRAALDAPVAAADGTER